jgi:hypothetical protein
VIHCVRRPAPPGVSSAAAERTGLPALAGREADGADEQELYCPAGQLQAVPLCGSGQVADEQVRTALTPELAYLAAAAAGPRPQAA